MSPKNQGIAKVSANRSVAVTINSRRIREPVETTKTSVNIKQREAGRRICSTVILLLLLLLLLLAEVAMVSQGGDKK